MVRNGINSATKEVDTLAQAVAESLKVNDKVESTLGVMDKVQADMEEGSSNLLLASQEQEAAIEETTASVEEITQQLASIASIAQSRIERLDELSSHIDKNIELNHLVSNTNKEVAVQNDEVQKMVKEIQKISTQTNLLAMNAAIEAAHAGDAGRGFAVVAEEIRNLSDQSREASNFIKKALKGLDTSVESSSNALIELEGIGSKVVNETKSTVDSFKELSNMIYELSQGGQEILKAVSSLREISSVLRTQTSVTEDNVESLKRVYSEITSSVELQKNIVEKIAVGFTSMRENFTTMNTAQQQFTELENSIISAVGDFKV